MHNTNIKNYLFSKLSVFLLITLVIASVYCDNNSKIAFQFPEFDYKETSKNVSNIISISYCFIDFPQTIIMLITVYIILQNLL